MIRLQKYLAERGIASRRKCEELISLGRVSVDGVVITEMGFKINGDEKVYVNNKLVENKETLEYVMLNKPEGYITSSHDQFERPTVLDIVNDTENRLFPVGRLDYDTSGLLLLTNDGDLTYKLTHPKHDIEKTYIARVVGIPTKFELKRMEEGLVIDGYKLSPCKCFIVNSNENEASIKIIIKEGKNRQVRKMCDAIGHRVIGLIRIATGELQLGELKKGEYRHLTDDELEYLKNL